MVRMSIEKLPRLPGLRRQGMRLQLYSINTGGNYCGWIRKFVRSHGMKSIVGR